MKQDGHLKTLFHCSSPFLLAKGETVQIDQRVI